MMAFFWMALLAFGLVYGLAKLLLPKVIAVVNTRFGVSEKQDSDKPPLHTVPEHYFAVLVAVLCVMVVLLLALAIGSLT